MASTTGAGGGAWSSGGSTAAVAAMEERRLKQRASNRESARRARARRQQQLDELEAEAEALRGSKAALEDAVRAAAGRRAAVEGENAVLRAGALELGARLRSLSLAGLLLQQQRCMGGDGVVPSGSCSAMQQQQPQAMITASQPDIMYSGHYYC